MEVAELVDIPMTRAVLVRGTLYVRSDLPFPTPARAWFVAPSCRTPGAFRLRGDWLSVEGPHEPRFDGDIRPPYRLGIHVTEGPRAYRGTTVQVCATEHTHPALGPPDVKRSLWGGGKLVARVRCEDDRFIAEALVSTPG